MTLNELPACITHHWEMGDISNQGIYNSLLAKANAAISAHDRGQTNAAINVLDALINEVSNLSSKQITADAAAHIIEHAQNAI